MRSIVLSLILSITFIVESLFSLYFPYRSFGNLSLIVPHFLLVLLVLMGIFYIRKQTIIYALVFGVLFDVYYVGVIGLYLLVFPLTVYIASKMTKYLHSSFLVTGLIVLVNLIVAELVIYEMNGLINNDSLEFVYFVVHRLLPTLTLNVIFFIIVFLPFQKFLQRRKQQIEG